MGQHSGSVDTEPLSQLVDLDAPEPGSNQLIDLYRREPALLLPWPPNRRLGGDAFRGQRRSLTPPGIPRKEVARRVADSDEATRTLALGPDHCHPDDILLAVDVDRFAFAMEVTRDDLGLRLARVDPA